MVDMNQRMSRFLNGTSQRRTNRRRFVQGGAALGLSTVSLASLGRRLASAQDGAVLQFAHDKTPWQEFFVEMGDQAQEAIGVNWEPSAYADTTSYQAALLSALPTDDAPDFFTWWSGFRLEDLYEEGVLHDLSDLWSAAIADGNLPESLSPAFTFEDKQYAMPSHVSYWVVFYNKRLFAEHSLTPPSSWEEMTAAAETLTGAGVTPFGATQVGRWPSFIWFEELVLRTDPSFYAALTAGEAKYTDETCVKAMETWKTLIDADYFTSLDVSLDDMAGLFAQDELAMFPIGTWYQSHFLTAGLTPGEDFDLFLMPNVEPSLTEKVAIVETGALAVATNSQQVDAAKEMAAWWVTPEAQTEWANKLGDAPANPKAKSDNPVLTNLLTTLATENVTLYQRYWEASPVPIVEGAVDFLSEFMLNPEDYMSVLERIQELADREWAARKA